jgi:nitroreductase
MTTTPDPDGVRRVVDLATRAPSIHNTQPWRWRASGQVLHLHADTERQLVAADPDGRNLAISCGAALHHALVAAAALGLDATTERLPEGPSSTLLARLTLRCGTPSDTAEVDLATIHDRRTDRRRFTSWPVPDTTLQHLAGIAQQHGTHASPLLDVTERFRTELLIGYAAELQLTDDRVVKEQQDWVERSPVDGIPAAVLPAERSAMAGAPWTRFPLGDLEEHGREIESSDGLIVLCGGTDDPPSWLAAGEGLSALWLAATAQGLAVVPLSQVVEVVETRTTLTEQVLGGLANPFILARIGWQPISRSDVPRTARRPLDDVLEIS